MQCARNGELELRAVVQGIRESKRPRRPAPRAKEGEQRAHLRFAAHPRPRVEPQPRLAPVGVDDGVNLEDRIENTGNGPFRGPEWLTIPTDCLWEDPLKYTLNYANQCLLISDFLNFIHLSFQALSISTDLACRNLDTLAACIYSDDPFPFAID